MVDDENEEIVSRIRARAQVDEMGQRVVDLCAAAARLGWQVQLIEGKERVDARHVVLVPKMMLFTRGDKSHVLARDSVSLQRLEVLRRDLGVSRDLLARESAV